MARNPNLREAHGGSPADFRAVIRDEPEKRLNDLYTESKHAESRIENGQMPKTGPLPVWLDNAGLRSTDAKLSFAEMAHVLTQLGEWARALEDPPSTEERVRALPY